MRTKVFAYKNYIGISSDFDTEGLLNKPEDKGQLGFVMDASKIDFSKKAIILLKQIPKSNDDIGDVDVFKADNGMVIFAWLGGPKTVINMNDKAYSGSSTYAPELLSEGSHDILPDDDFVQYIDSL